MLGGHHMAYARGCRAAAVGGGAEVGRLPIGVEDALEDRLERARHDGQAQGGEHRLDGGIGLLGGEAALLEREVGDVARGVDAVGARHATVVVHRDEALGILRQVR